MKVLFLTNIPAPYRVDFFNELGKFCDLTVLYELGYATDRDENWKGNTAKYFNEVYLNGKKIGNDSAICLSVIEYIKDKQYDTIVIGGYSTITGMLAIEYLKLKRKPFILSTDGGIIKDDNKVKFNIKKYFISRASAWLSTGQKTSEYLINYGANPNKIYTYPLTSIRENDIVESMLEDREKRLLRKKLGIVEEKVVISVGQFIYRKGFDVLIEAMAILPKDYGVYIIGGIPSAEYLELVKKYNLKNIHFEGFKTKEELKEFYRAADVFVLPTREDIWGLVINEAMAYGLPIITTEKCVAGIELVKQEENGYIVPTDDAVSIANKIKVILENNDIKERMSKNTIKIINKYTIENMARIHKKIFNKLKDGY